MESLTIFDYTFFGILLISSIVGYVTGLAKELLTLLSGFGAIGAAFFTYHLFGDSFSKQMAQSTGFDLAIIIYVVVAIASYVILATVFSMLTNGMMEQRTVSLVDSLLGLGLGMARGFVIGVLFVFFIDVFIDRERLPVFVTEAYSYPLLERGSDLFKRAYMSEPNSEMDNSTKSE